MLRCSLIVMALILPLVGCGGMSGPDAKAALESDPASPAAAVEENPYLEDQRRVSETARQRFAAATAAMATEDWETARADLEWLVEHNPELSGPYLNLALLHATRGNAARAEQLFEVAMEVNPRNLEAYNQYAIFLRQQGRFDESERIYLAALAVWDSHAATHRNLGVLYDLYRGEREKALAHYYRYQALTGGADRAVSGWIIDLERQFPQVVQRGAH
jgi:Tfp pilus assembly protein PilF